MAENENNGISLRWQICALVSAALLFGLLTMGLWTFSQSDSIVTSITLDSLSAQTDAAAAGLERTMTVASNDVRQIPQFPPIPGIIRALDNQGEDPEQRGSTTEIWIQRLTTILHSQMDVNPERLLCTVTDESGKILMSVDRSGLVAAEDALSSQENSLFAEATTLAENELAISPMTKQEDGKVVVRIATPFFDVQGKCRGVFETVIDGSMLLKQLRDLVPSGTMDVVDQEGRYLFCSEDRTKEFSNDLYAKDKPVRARSLADLSSENDSYKAYIPGHPTTRQCLVNRTLQAAAL